MRGVKIESYIGIIKNTIEDDLKNNTQILFDENLEITKAIVIGNAQIISPNNSKNRNGYN